MTHDDYVDLVERRYFGNVAQADIPAVVACFTDDAQVTIYHGDAAPRRFKARPTAGETPLPRFFEHLLANYDPQFTEFVPLRGCRQRALRRDVSRDADAEARLTLPRRWRAAPAQQQLLPLPGRSHPRDDHLLQQPRHRRRRRRPRRPPHRVSAGLTRGLERSRLHGNALALFRSRQPACGRRLREGAAFAAGRGRGLSRARHRRPRSNPRRSSPAVGARTRRGPVRCPPRSRSR